MTTLTCPAPTVKTRKPATDSHGTCGLTLRIAGVAYRVRPIIDAAPELATRAFRLAKADGLTYDIAETPHGLTCDCPDWTFRHDGQGTLCKHLGACVAVGLLSRPTPAAPALPRRLRDEFDAPAPTAAPEREWVCVNADEMADGPQWGPSAVAPIWSLRRKPEPEPVEAQIARVRDKIGPKPAPEPEPCCSPSEAAPCLACEPVPAPEPPAGDFSTELARAVDPTILDDESAPSEWPAWTDSDIWVPGDDIPGDDGPGDDGSRLDLEAWLRDQADFYRMLGHAAGELVAEALEDLAGQVELTNARDVATYRDRIACLTPTPNP